MRLVVEIETDGAAVALARDEAVLRSVADGAEEAARAWVGDRSIVVGRSQRVEDEVDMDAARDAGLTIVRRLSGGGTVVQYPGNLNVSVISRWAGHDRSVAGVFCAAGEAISDGLRRAFGVPVTCVKNRMEIGGRKVGGAAQARRGDAVLYHTTLMVTPCPRELLRLLRAHRSGYRPTGVASEPRLLTSLLETQDCFGTLDDAARAALGGLRRALGGGWRDVRFLSDEELEVAGGLSRAKYGSETWTMQRTPT
jgi:lipoate-protein ligase A